MIKWLASLKVIKFVSVGTQKQNKFDAIGQGNFLLGARHTEPYENADFNRICKGVMESMTAR
jgi:hypothetical protein